MDHLVRCWQIPSNRHKRSSARINVGYPVVIAPESAGVAIGNDKLESIGRDFLNRARNAVSASDLCFHRSILILRVAASAWAFDNSSLPHEPKWLAVFRYSIRASSSASVSSVSILMPRLVVVPDPQCALVEVLLRPRCTAGRRSRLLAGRCDCGSSVYPSRCTYEHRTNRRLQIPHQPWQ